MRVIEFRTNEAMALNAMAIVKDELQKNQALLLCAATGNSPLPLYQKMVLESKKNKGLFDRMRILTLDEWIGLSTSKDSCDTYLREYLVGPLNISEERYFGFNAKSQNLDKECARMQRYLNEDGPIDLCILGLGANGHLGFNEPAVTLQPHCHIAKLAKESRQHTMLKGTKTLPTRGLTLGIQDILSSNRILLIISGSGKEKVKRAFFTGKVEPQLPASLLWQHHNVDCLVVK